MRIKLYGPKNADKKRMKEAIAALDKMVKDNIEKYLIIPKKNPERIKRILKVVEKYWEKNPDLRLGQLIGNMSVTNDSYFMSDELLEQCLVKALNQLKIK